MQTYDDTTTRVAAIVETLFNDEVSLIDVSRDSETNQIFIVILYDDTEQMLTWVE